MVCQEPPEAQNDKSEVLQPAQNNPTGISGVGTDWKGSSFAKKPLRVLVNQKGNTSQLYVLYMPLWQGGMAAHSCITKCRQQAYGNYYFPLYGIFDNIFRILCQSQTRL